MKFQIISLIAFGMIVGCGAHEKASSSDTKVQAEINNANQPPATDPIFVNENNSVTGTAIDIPEEQLEIARKLIGSVSATDLKNTDGQMIYRAKCAECHGNTGGMSINGSKILAQTNTNLEQRVSQILTGKGNMRPFEGELKGAEIVAVAKYLDELKKP